MGIYASRGGLLKGFKIRVGMTSPAVDASHFDTSSTCWSEAGDNSGYAIYTCTPALTGRFVSIRIEGQTQYLCMYEVQVYGNVIPEVLLSQGKTASLSSQYQSFVASNANDGDVSTLAISSCALDGAGPWWGVDLGGVRPAGAGISTLESACCLPSCALCLHAR